MILDRSVIIELIRLTLNRGALATRRVEAAFPTGKTFANWDQNLSSVPAAQTVLRTLAWIGRRENLVVCGPSGIAAHYLSF